MVYKVNEGRPNIADEIVNRKIDLIVNTPLGRESFFDDRAVRRAAMMHEVPCITTLTGAAAAVSAIRALRQQALGVRALQDYYAGIAAQSLTKKNGSDREGNLIAMRFHSPITAENWPFFRPATRDRAGYSHFGETALPGSAADPRAVPLGPSRARP